MKKHSYLVRIVRAGDTMEVYKTQSGRFGCHDTHAPRQKPTPVEMERYNRRCTEDRVRQLVNENFKDGDFHVQLHYFPHMRPPDKEAAASILKNFLRRVRYQCEKQGTPLKYLYAPAEIGARGGVHHHIIINKVDTDILNNAWKEYGAVHFTPLYSDGQYGNLGVYILKQTQFGEEWNGRRYVASRNLRRPQEEVRRVNASTWRKTPACPKGYREDKDFPLENGVCAVTGFAYQRCGFRRIPPANTRQAGRAPKGAACAGQQGASRKGKGERVP